ncbi:hypothetical protein SNEBB_002312 [Seison nebaliae]|nr:hypothetical protein SNEBB_002312 [Seison nebaliae]
MENFHKRLIKRLKRLKDSHLIKKEEDKNEVVQFLYVVFLHGLNIPISYQLKNLLWSRIDESELKSRLSFYDFIRQFTHHSMLKEIESLGKHFIDNTDRSIVQSKLWIYYMLNQKELSFALQHISINRLEPIITLFYTSEAYLRHPIYWAQFCKEAKKFELPNFQLNVQKQLDVNWPNNIIEILNSLNKPTKLDSMSIEYSEMERTLPNQNEVLTKTEKQLSETVVECDPAIDEFMTRIIVRHSSDMEEKCEESCTLFEEKENLKEHEREIEELVEDDKSNENLMDNKGCLVDVEQGKEELIEEEETIENFIKNEEEKKHIGKSPNSFEDYRNRQIALSSFEEITGSLNENVLSNVNKINLNGKDVNELSTSYSDESTLDDVSEYSKEIYNNENKMRLATLGTKNILVNPRTIPPISSFSTSHEAGKICKFLITQSLINPIKKEVFIELNPVRSSETGNDSDDTISVSIETCGNCFPIRKKLFCPDSSEQNGDNLLGYMVQLSIHEKEMKWKDVTSCFQCKAKIDGFGNKFICHYYQEIFCYKCHHQNSSIIPLYVVNLWDFNKFPVCNDAKDIIELLLERPCLNIMQYECMLAVASGEFKRSNKLRTEFCQVMEYLSKCSTAKESIVQQIKTILGNREYYIDSSTWYSLMDLINAKDIVEKLNLIMKIGKNHILKDCETCRLKGFVCELCNINMIIYPFTDGTHRCQTCGNVYHQECWMNNEMNNSFFHCPKCQRRLDRMYENESDYLLS